MRMLFFKPSTIKSYDLKRLFLHQSLNRTGRAGAWLLTVQLLSVWSIQEEVVIKITVLVQTMRDSDFHVGIGNARGFHAAAYIIDNHPYASLYCCLLIQNS